MALPAIALGRGKIVSGAIGATAKGLTVAAKATAKGATVAARATGKAASATGKAVGKAAQSTAKGFKRITSKTSKSLSTNSKNFLVFGTIKFFHSLFFFQGFLLK